MFLCRKVFSSPDMVQFTPLRPYRPAITYATAITTQAFEKPLEAEYPHIPPSPDYSFQHVLQPESFAVRRLPENERLTIARRELEAFIEQELLEREEQPAAYVYQQQSGPNLHTGIVGGLSRQDYDRGHIREHEQVHRARAAMLLDFYREVGVNGTPVLMAHPDNRELEAWKAEVMAGLRLYNFTTKDGTQHAVWRTMEHEQLAQLEAIFQRIPTLYIADGHHRSSAFSSYAREKSDRGAPDLPLMAYTLPASQLNIASFHRLLHSLPVRDVQTFLEQASHLFLIEKLEEARLPNREGELVVCIGKQWYSWTVRSAAYEADTHCAKLDVYILDQAFLKGTLGMDVNEENANMRFVEGTMRLARLRERAEAESVEVVFLLHPIGMQTLMELSDAGETLPPKSTWIEPKLRSGLFVQPLAEPDPADW